MILAGLILSTSISWGPLCFEPPSQELKDQVDEFGKFRDESVNLKTRTDLGTFSMAVSGVSLGAGASGNLEIGLAHIADVGGIVPQRIEITPFVYNQLGVSEAQGVDLNRDQGAGLKVQMGNAEREWAFFVKGSLSADGLLSQDSGQDVSVPAQVNFGLTRNFGAEDAERLKNLQRLRRLKQPVVITVSPEEFDGTMNRSSESIRTIHSAIMAQYFPEAIQHWYQENSRVKDIDELLDFYVSSPPRLYEFLRRQLTEGRPLYVESTDGRQKIVRPTRYEPGMVEKDVHLFNSNQMLLDFATGVEFTSPSPQRPDLSSPQSSRPEVLSSP